MKKARNSAVVSVLALAALTFAPLATSHADAVTINVQDYYTPGPSVIHTIITDCATQNGATANITSVPGDQLIAKILQQSSSHTLPDIEMLDNPDVAAVASTGALLPLDGFGITSAGIIKGVASADSYQGQLYALQPITNSIALFYNVDILKKAGIKPPITWAELAVDAKKLSHGNKYGLAFSAKADYEGTWQFLPFMWTAGAIENNINTPAMVKAVQFWVDLFKAHSVSRSALQWAQSDVNNQFIAGNAAMMINGPWQYPALNAVKSLHWAVVPTPSLVPGKPSQSPLGGEGWALGNTGNTANEAIAAKIISCINSDANILKFAAGGGVVPTHTNLLAGFASANPQMAAWAKVVVTARARTGLLGAGWPAAATKIYKAYQFAIVGGKTAQQAVAAAASGN